MIFNNREHAGELLARRLIRYKGKNPLVLGIPRGAVPMAKIIADALGGELDVVLVRKLGYPGQPELAIGAVDESGATFLADCARDVEVAYLKAEKKKQAEVIRRRRALYTPTRLPIDPHDRIVIVVDDGIATGATMITALRAIRAKKPKNSSPLSPSHRPRRRARLRVNVTLWSAWTCRRNSTPSGSSSETFPKSSTKM